MRRVVGSSGHRLHPSQPHTWLRTRRSLSWTVCLSSDGPHDSERLVRSGGVTMEHKRFLTPAQKAVILERDSYICGYCYEEATEVDHIVPFSYSYDDNPLNLIACCRDCNAIASDHVFANLAEKQHYILGKREGRKWTKRFKKRQPCRCCDCHIAFYPLAHKATMFLCPHCARAACKLMPRDYQAYLERRRAYLEEAGIVYNAFLQLPSEKHGESSGSTF
jgi:hypothetical protein